MSHVNSYWRSVAIRETRRLWTHVHLSDVSHMGRAKTYMQRSSRMLIDVIIDTESAEDHIPGRTLFRDEFRSVFEIVVPHILRWRSFILKVRDHQCKASARAELSRCGPAPSLSCLHISHIETSAGAENFWMSTVRPPVIFFDGKLPSLRGLQLIGVSLPWASSHSPFLKDLTSIELALHCEHMRPTYDQWAAMLRRCPTLQSLSLHYSGPRASPGWPDDPICLPSLTELSIADIDPDHLCSIFQRLTLTNLKHLRLELQDQDYTPFLDLVRNSKSINLSKLEFLRFDTMECSLESWEKLLRASPSIQILEVDFRRTPKGFFEVLFHADESAVDEEGGEVNLPFLPLLTGLRMAAISGSDLVRFHQYRKDLGRPMQDYWINAAGRDKDMDDLSPDANVSYFEDEDDEAERDAEGEHRYGHPLAKPCC